MFLQVRFNVNTPTDCSPAPEPRPVPTTSTPIFPSTSRYTDFNSYKVSGQALGSELSKYSYKAVNKRKNKS